MKKCTMIMLLALAGCAFKGEDNKQTRSESSKVRSGFIPGERILVEGSRRYVLIDVVTLPSGDYQVNQSTPVRGIVEHSYQYPIFKELNCEGIGYSLSYETRKRAATEQLKLKIYIDQKLTDRSQLTVSRNEVIALAVYAEFDPIADFYERGQLPSEFVKTVMPNGQCRSLCTNIRTTPLRPLVRKLPLLDCNWWNRAWDYPTNTDRSTVTNDLEFSPLQIENQRGTYLQKLFECNAATSNEDLRILYDRAADEACPQYNNKMLLREWGFVEQKIAYAEPTYSIANLNEIVKTTSGDTQIEVKGYPAAKASDWSN